MVKIWDFLPVRNENVPHISTESLPRNVQNNTGNLCLIHLIQNQIPNTKNKILKYLLMFLFFNLETDHKPASALKFRFVLQVGS